MKTANKNLFFFTSKTEARNKFNELNKPVDLLENWLPKTNNEWYLNGYYVEIRTGEKTLNEINHRTHILIAQK